MNANNELCAECFGEGKIASQSKAISSNLVLRRCNTCKGLGTVASISNSAFLNNGSIFNQIIN